MTPDEARADERRRIVERLEARAVSEDVCRDRTKHHHEDALRFDYAASVLHEEARAIAALGPVAPVDDALLMRVAEMAWRDGRSLACFGDGCLDPDDTCPAAAIIERAKGGA